MSWDYGMWWIESGQSVRLGVAWADGKRVGAPYMLATPWSRHWQPVELLTTDHGIQLREVKRGEFVKTEWWYYQTITNVAEYTGTWWSLTGGTP